MRRAAHVPGVCTVIVLIRPGFVLLAANRDERLDRAWDPPAAWWPEHPGVIGGRDRSGGGTWMGLNRWGVAAAVLNRPGTLGPAAGKRSRGVLPLLALRHGSAAAAAAAAVGAADAGDWRPFNMVVADRRGAWFVRGLGAGRPEVAPLPAGVSMVTAHDPNDTASPRTARHLPRLRRAEPAGLHQWAGWRAILADRGGTAAEQINVVPRAGFGTVCSSVVGWRDAAEPVWLFAAGPPHAHDFKPVFFRWDSPAIPATPPEAVTT